MTSAANAMDNKAPTEPLLDDSILTPHRKTQIVVIVASVACAAMFWFVGQWLGIPGVRRFQGSVLQLPRWPLDLGVIYVLLILSALIGSAIAGRFWFHAGLFAACVGLTTLSIRGGAMRYVLFDAYAGGGGGPKVFLQLLSEHCLLFLPIAAVWMFFSRGYERAVFLSLSPEERSAEAKRDPGGPILMSLLIQTLLMGAMIYFLTPTDAKKQIVVAVFLSALASTSAAEHFAYSRKAVHWYWVAPCVIGIVAYLMAYLNAGDFTLGVANGMLANLAQPLPLDYAGVAIAGTLLGYWMGAERPEQVAPIFAANVFGHAIRIHDLKSLTEDAKVNDDLDPR
jgi:hypothetical protein